MGLDSPARDFPTLRGLIPVFVQEVQEEAHYSLFATLLHHTLNPRLTQHYSAPVPLRLAGGAGGDVGVS